MRVYISGPVTGQEDTAGRRFRAARRDVADNFGYDVEVVDPFHANDNIFRFCWTKSHEDCMVTSMAMLSLCDAIYMMRGWEESDGCMEEHTYAVAHGYKIFYQDDE